MQNEMVPLPAQQHFVDVWEMKIVLRFSLVPPNSASFKQIPLFVVPSPFQDRVSLSSICPQTYDDLPPLAFPVLGEPECLIIY